MNEDIIESIELAKANALLKVLELKQELITLTNSIKEQTEIVNKLIEYRKDLAPSQMGCFKAEIAKFPSLNSGTGISEDYFNKIEDALYSDSEFYKTLNTNEKSMLDEFRIIFDESRSVFTEYMQTWNELIFAIILP